MNRKIFSIIGLIFLSIILFGTGLWLGQTRALNTKGQPGWMMGNMNNDVQLDYGMMNDTGMMGMMMNNGMMGSTNNQNMTGMMGMMSGFSGLSDVDPLTLAEVETAVTNYLASLNQENFTLGEIIIFSNHAYAQVLDNDTGLGAFELLVDPATGNIFHEPGPNMMWNTLYSLMSGFGGGMMGSGMMSSYGYAPDAEINITADEAVTVAQAFLDTHLPDKTAANHADTFPGYYTLHILEDDETIGMLSVNAYTGQIFLHHWHGDFIEMSEGLPE